YFQECDIRLENGWNLFSLYCNNENMSLSNVMKSVDGSYISVHTYIASESLDKWKAYKVGLPWWVVSDLGNISVERGYWINMNNQDNIVINGTLTLPSLIPLYEGWNLVGFTNNESEPINSTMASFIDQVESVHMYNASDVADHWKVYYSSATGDLDNLYPNYGYWVSLNGSALWILEG
ncbi:hypothetical protein KY320_01990, partial [Candidatus Woesearchaeota archaeon]|nr:hypothetical protein [Candidatus Woesearchaeota archaeon]